jgi:hypothetical protein
MTTKSSLPACTILDGKVHVYKREGSPYWWVGFHYKGKYIRKTSKQSDLGAAKAFALDWFFKKQTEIASGEISSPKYQFDAVEKLSGRCFCD